VIYERLTSSEDNLATTTLGHLDELASEGNVEYSSMTDLCGV